MNYQKELILDRLGANYSRISSLRREFFTYQVFKYSSVGIGSVIFASNIHDMGTISSESVSIVSCMIIWGACKDLHVGLEGVLRAIEKENLKLHKELENMVK